MTTFSYTEDACKASRKEICKLAVTWTFGVIDFSKKVPCGHFG